ncbi:MULTISPECIES: formimidoylglutamase [Virgibacillus]|uniref:Formimidoylglutamase n=1 Tax=Virgibacillus dokdonensis TaxID=302167 RepID=A0A2K9J0X4_9BACI|nr:MULTISPECIES: formimidoylglutamase [Virgibacillus]AUJ25607.1 Formimidoylglutamase [Virgibacillus dokdonensis]NWO12177.1 formimidoylglutamase [Virgibacillus sp.]
MYSMTEKQWWSGRVDHATDPAYFRFHQAIQLKDIASRKRDNDLKGSIALIGFSSDEGVRRNKGRVGAAKAPYEIRSVLANLAYHLEKLSIFDVGNVSCIHQQLEESQEELGKYMHYLLQAQSTPIILGGGHETLYGHYLGARQYVNQTTKLGIINIDAHFDLRNDFLPTSGTMFKQILEQDKYAGYLCLGIQKWGNTQALFQEAAQYQSNYILAEDVANDSQTIKLIDDFTKQHDYIIFTLCMDAVEATAAPGVSAPSPLGLEPKIVRDLIRYIVAKPNLLSMDISEVNPVVDENNKTVKLAAYFIADAMQSMQNRKNML